MNMKHLKKAAAVSLAALAAAGMIAGCGGEKQAEVAAQEAMADTMINSGSAGGSSGFSETYEMEKLCIFM